MSGRQPALNVRVTSRRLLLAATVVALVAGARAYQRRDVTVIEKRHANGTLAERREYRRGREDGIHRGWHENGAPRFVFHYVNGLAEGVQEEWYPDGTRYTRFEYVGGHEAGHQQMWTDKGVLRANYVVEHGRRFGLMGTTGCKGTSHDDSLVVDPAAAVALAEKAGR